jgi:hypothetical protein
MTPTTDGSPSIENFSFFEREMGNYDVWTITVQEYQFLRVLILRTAQTNPPNLINPLTKKHPAR